MILIDSSKAFVIDSLSQNLLPRKIQNLGISESSTTVVRELHDQKISDNLYIKICRISSQI